MIDSHVHLDSFDQDGSLDETLSRARKAGVSSMIAIGGSSEANHRACRIAAEVDDVYATVGYDRDLAGENPDLSDLERCVALPKVVGVGETGLDYHYEADKRDEQLALFSDMLDLAHRHSLPVVVHSREADADTLECLQRQQSRWQGAAEQIGVLHCFTGDAKFANALVELGLFISFSGILTFKNAGDLREVAASLPIEKLLIETDAPYLAPVPFRGKTNEPAYVLRVAETLAELLGMSVDDVVRVTRENSQRLFNLAVPEEGVSS